MRISKDPVLDIESGRWGADVQFDWDGPVELLGGPTAEAKSNEAAQTAFYNQMTQEQTIAFGQQQDLLNAIKAVNLPILQMGPNAYGFTAAEDALLKGEIRDTGAQAETNAVNAQQLREKQVAGGANIMPTGAQEELEMDAKLLGEQNTAKGLTQETLAGYQAGQQRYAQAESALTGNASLLNPTSYATATTGAGSNATSAVNLADSERSNLLSSILGGVVGAGTSFLTGGLSNITGGGGFLSPKGAT